ncbi:MAG: DUF2808 domain-containing protein [Symploca sp. SIO2C1]|nr:DUF2808 domain-containing protein [Symploca sp. SIO2C1]
MFISNKNLGSTKARLLGTSALMLGILLPSTLSSLPANAVELGENKTFFDRSPRLTRVATSTTTANIPATYQFTISLPEDAGEPLQAVTINQQENLENIKFDLNQSSAFIGNSFAGGPAISLANVGGSQSSDGNEVTVMFDEPVLPGSEVTVSLRAKRNPQAGGVYLFGVTAFSIGDNSPGLYLGSRDLHLGDSD